MEYHGYEIYQPTSDVKARKGTSSLQVRNIPIGMQCVFSLKNITYKVGDLKSYKKALERAKKFIDCYKKVLE